MNDIIIIAPTLNEKENIKIRSFFAPNHTYDLNTFLALKDKNLLI